MNYFRTLLIRCVSLLVIFAAQGCSKSTIKPEQPKSAKHTAARISEAIEKRIGSEQLADGEHTDAAFISQKKNDLLLNYKQTSPDANEATAVNYICQNLSKGEWLVSIDDFGVFGDGQKIQIDNTAVTIKKGYEYLALRLRKIDKEALRLFSETVIVEIIHVGIRIQKDKRDGIELEIGRLYPINNHGVTDEMISELLKTTPNKR